MSEARRSMRRLLLVATLSLTSCPDANRSPCPEECDRGMACDEVTGTCVLVPLSRYERPLPGHGARVASGAAHVWIASIDTSDDVIVVTEIGENDDRDPRILAALPNADDRKVAIDASGRLVAVAWLRSSGRYDIAYRSLPGSHDSWNFTTIEEADGGPYAGTDDFDLVVVEDRGLALAFRDRAGTLRILRTSGPTAPWTLEIVDDGGRTDDDVTCPDERRQQDPGLGVGRDPSLGTRGDELVVAYQDADCGDLRLARKGDERWSVVVVDAGDVDLERGATRAFVGRWPSVAFGPAGNLLITYHDESRGRLLLATEDSGRFETEVIDPGVEIDAFSRERKKIVGAFSKLTLDGTSAATVTYLDATAGDLMLARREGGSSTWSRSTVASDGAVGFFADHVVEPGLGRYVVAERVVPTGDGLDSELVVVEIDR